MGREGRRSAREVSPEMSDDRNVGGSWEARELRAESGARGLKVRRKWSSMCPSALFLRWVLIGLAITL